MNVDTGFELWRTLTLIGTVASSAKKGLSTNEQRKITFGRVKSLLVTSK